MTANLYGNIPAISIIYQVLKGNQHLFRTIHIRPSINIIVDCDKSHTEIRKYLFNIAARFNVVSAKPGQILYNHTVYPAGFNIFQHCSKSRTLKIYPCKTIIHHFSINVNILMGLKKFFHKSLLIYNAVAFRLISVFS